MGSIRSHLNNVGPFKSYPCQSLISLKVLIYIPSNQMSQVNVLICDVIVFSEICFDMTISVDDQLIILYACGLIFNLQLLHLLLSQLSSITLCGHEIEDTASYLLTYVLQAHYYHLVTNLVMDWCIN